MRRTIATATGVTAFAFSAVAFAARFVPISNRAILAAAALAPYLGLGAPISVVAFVLRRCWIWAAMAAALTAATVAVRLPWYTRSRITAADAVSVRIVSANLLCGRAEPDAVVQLARANADVLAVQELTPDEADRLSAAGLDDTFPYRAMWTQEGPGGVGIWSRYPIEHSDTVDSFWLGLLTARVRVPRLPTAAIVVVAHLSAPWPDPLPRWRADMDRLANTLNDIAEAAAGRPVVLAADLNATADMREFRRLLRGGYRDAAEQAGAGLTRTHPANPSLPPLLAIDHILTRDCTATSVRTLSLPGSDHRGLAAEIVLPT